MTVIDRRSHIAQRHRWTIRPGSVDHRLEVTMSAYEEYRRGFLEGYRAMKGDRGPKPIITGVPNERSKQTPFQSGLDAGRHAASH